MPNLFSIQHHDSASKRSELNYNLKFLTDHKCYETWSILVSYTLSQDENAISSADQVITHACGHFSPVGYHSQNTSLPEVAFSDDAANHATQRKTKIEQPYKECC